MGVGISLLKKVATSIDNANQKVLKEEKTREQEKAQFANDRREQKEIMREINVGLAESRVELAESRKAVAASEQEYRKTMQEFREQEKKWKEEERIKKEDIKHILENDKKLFESRILQRKNMRIEIMRKNLR